MADQPDDLLTPENPDEGATRDSAEAGGATAPRQAPAPRSVNPFRRFSRNGRLPTFTRHRIAPKVDVLEEQFDRRSTMYLREFKQNSPLKGPRYPRFLSPMRQFSIKVGGHTLRCAEVLGYGRFGIVFKATIQEAGMEVAVKFMFAEGAPTRNTEEFKKAKQLPIKLFDSGLIITYLALCDLAPYENAHAELIIMELAENGDLFDSIVSTADGGATQRPVVYSSFHARRLSVMIIEAMSNLRAAGFLHRDLKAENLLFTKDGQMVLGDIGNIKDLDGGDPLRDNTVLGSENTMAPEVAALWHRRQGHGFYDCERSDVWSIACIHFQLRSCLPLLDRHVLKAQIQDFTPATANSPANASFWAKWDKWQHGIRPGGKYASVAWTKDYQTEDFSAGERAFLNSLLLRKPSHRPTLQILLLATRGDRATLARHPGLKWLSLVGKQTGDSNLSFNKEMQKRIAGYGRSKNMVAWPYSGGPAKNVTPEAYMKQVAEHMRSTMKAVVASRQYTSDLDDLSKTTMEETFIQIHATIATGVRPADATPEGETDAGVQVIKTVRIIVEIEKPSDDLKGCITFVRQSGDSSLYLQLLQRFAGK